MSKLPASPEHIVHPDGYTVYLKRSRRKTMALKVQQGRVTVHMPQTLSMPVVRQFISDKSSWLRRQLDRHATQPRRHFTLGEQQLLLGQWYASQQGAGNARRCAVRFHDDTFVLETRPSQTADNEIFHQQLKNFYRAEAQDYLPTRVHELARMLNLFPESVRVRYYKSRWGSCHGNQEIRLNWQLIQAPTEIIDYVIIHELCHLQHMNHSPHFWSLVEKHCPDYRQHRQWLRDNGFLLQI